jgi:uncharacterized protein YjiS (DUF1127 family)
VADRPFLVRRTTAPNRRSISKKQRLNACTGRIAAAQWKTYCTATCSFTCVSKEDAGIARIRKDTIMLVAILNFLRAWKRYNASLNELYQLGDRELADIGITRSDIPRIAWQNANR